MLLVICICNNCHSNIWLFTLIIQLNNHTQAHAAIQKLWLHIKAELLAGNKQVLELRSYSDALSTQQRKYYHGVVLNEIAKQAVIEGRKYKLEIWKEHFRDKYLGEEVITVTNPMTGVEKREVIRVSSESLTVKGYNELIEKVTAFASTDLGVNFHTTFDEYMAQDE